MINSSFTYHIFYLYISDIPLYQKHACTSQVCSNYQSYNTRSRNTLVYSIYRTDSYDKCAITLTLGFIITYPGDIIYIPRLDQPY